MKEIIINDNCLLAKIYSEADKKKMSPKEVAYEILQKGLENVKIEKKALSKPKAIKRLF